MKLKQIKDFLCIKIQLDTKYSCLTGIPSALKFGPRMIERKTIIKNKSSIQIGVYYAPDRRRTKQIQEIDVGDGSWWNISRDLCERVTL